MTKTERGRWMIAALEHEPEKWKFKMYTAIYNNQLEIWIGTSGLYIWNTYASDDQGPRIGNWFQKRKIMKLIDDLKWTRATEGIVK